MFLNQAKSWAWRVGLYMALLLAAWGAEPAAKPPDQSASDLQSASRVDIQKVTGGPIAVPTNNNPTETKPASLLAPIAIIKSPAPRETVKDKAVQVRVGVQIPNPQSRAFHVIVNNDSPILVEDETKPLVLDKLNPGGNLIRILLVEPDGKVGPMPQSFAMSYFYFHKHDFSNIVRQDLPFLTVNLPLNGPAIPDEQGRVAFDYIVHNAVIAQDGIHIKYTLNQREVILSKPGPIYWNNLAPGRYQLVAELVDENGAPVLGTYCRVERTFEISRIMKPLQLEHEDPVLRELMTNAPANTSTNPPANYTTTNSPTSSTNNVPSTPKNDTIKNKRLNR